MNAHYPDPPREDTAESKGEINKRVQRRYDELRLAAKHGIYETIFRIVHEERDAAMRHYRDLLADLLAYAKDAPPEMQKRAADLLAGVDGDGQ